MNIVTDVAIAALLGGLLSIGALCVLATLPSWRAARLEVRIAPYVRDVVPDALLPRGVLPMSGALPVGMRGVWARAGAHFARLAGSSDALRIRLAQAGRELDPISFRARQLGWTVAGFAAGCVLVIALAVAGRASAPTVLLPAICAAASAVVYDGVLTFRARARIARLADELPTALEFLALCLSAGESLLDSLRRVATIGSGELTSELRHTVLAVSTGSPLSDALGELSSRLRLPGLSRAVDQVVAALEHGAPLAAVLHAQAADAREDAKRGLIEQAGRKEILMLLPLVFLILPLSVLFAVFPGIFILRFGIG
ncbi:type II secretion system F family protein [Microbacterium sp. NPDC055903]